MNIHTYTDVNLEHYLSLIVITISPLFRVGIEHTTGESMNAYLAATVSKPAPAKVEPVATPAALPAIAGSDSDSDSN